MPEGKEEKRVTVVIKGYDVDQINERIAKTLIREHDIDVIEFFENEVRRHLETLINDKVDEHMTKLVHDFLSEGMISSPTVVGEEQVRTPIKEVVLKAATQWMTSKADKHSNTSVYKKLVGDIIGYELTKQVTTILRDVRADAIRDVQANIGKIVSEKLFDGRNVLPAAR